jgi:hypothetical protein
MKTQEQAIGFTPGMLFSNGYVAGNTLYVAGATHFTEELQIYPRFCRRFYCRYRCHVRGSLFRLRHHISRGRV